MKKRNHSPEAEAESLKQLRRDEADPQVFIEEDNMDVTEEVIIEESETISKKVLSFMNQL